MTDNAVSTGSRMTKEVGRSIMADDPTIVHVTGLQKRYKKQVAVNGVDLTITKGEIYGLIGPDGSGKSSVM